MRSNPDFTVGVDQLFIELKKQPAEDRPMVVTAL